ncbi:hypothetical protein Tco_0579313 [Tanacetum coccineum]
MAEEQDKQQQQQNLLDAKLVPINEQVKISTRNFRIALEKTQPDVIYKVCLEILMQYSFYNAFITTADTPHIYMQKFWYTITYDLTAKAFFFTMGDKVFEVNADLLRNALSITPKDLDHPFTPPAPEKDIISFINQLRCSKTIKIISALRVNDMYRPWRTFLTMINKCLIGKATTHDRLRLPMLQLLWGMVTDSNVDCADLIWEEFKYQIQSRRVSRQKQELMPFSRFTKLIIKYILSKHDQVSKRPLYFHHVIKLDSTLIQSIWLSLEELHQSKLEAKDYSLSKGLKSLWTEEAHRESKEERVDHSKKLKGLETLGLGEGSGVTPKVPDELIFKSSNEGAGVTPEVPNEPSDYSSSSSSDSEFGVEDISSDEAEVTEKAVNVKIVDAEKDKEDQVAKEQPEMPDAPLISSSQTLSFAEFTSQFLNDNPQITVYDVLKDSIEPGVQSMVDNPVTQEKPTEPRPPLVDTTITLIPDTTTILPVQPPQT